MDGNTAEWMGLLQRVEVDPEWLVPMRPARLFPTPVKGGCQDIGLPCPALRFGIGDHDRPIAVELCLAIDVPHAPSEAEAFAGLVHIDIIVELGGAPLIGNAESIAGDRGREIVFRWPCGKARVEVAQPAIQTVRRRAFRIMNLSNKDCDHLPCILISRGFWLRMTSKVTGAVPDAARAAKN